MTNIESSAERTLASERIGIEAGLVKMDVAVQIERVEFEGQ